MENINLLEEVEFLNKRNLNPINEAYYGKNPLLTEIDDEFKKLKKILNDNMLNPNNNENIIKIQNNLKKLFNFENVVITIKPSKDVNAYNVPFYIEKLFYKRDELKLTKDSNGVKFKNPEGKSLYITITSKLIKKLEPKECTACLLHEVGHNFFLVEDHYKFYKLKFIMKQVMSILTILLQNLKKIKTPDNKISIEALLPTIYSVSIQLFSLIKFMISPQKFSYEKFKRQTNNFTLKNKEKSQGKINKIFSTVTKFAKGLLVTTMSPFILLCSLPFILYTKAAKRFISTNSMTYGSSDEKFADNFATSYGYGIELSKALQKIEKREKESNFLLKFFDGVTESMNYVCTYLTDPHPDTKERVKTTIEKLKFEIKTNKNKMTPSMLKECQEQINELENLYKEMDEERSSMLKFVQDKLGLAQDKKDINNKMTNDELFSAKFNDDLLKEGIKLLEEAFNEIEEDEELDELISEAFDIEDENVEIEMLQENGFTLTLRNFKSIIENSKVKACENGNFSDLKGNLIKIVNSCKDINEVNYLRRDLGSAINTFKKLSINLEKALKDPTNPKYKILIKRNKQGLTVKKINDYVNWLKTDYIKILNDKASEIKNKKSKVKKESTNINIDDELDELISEAFDIENEDDEMEMLQENGVTLILRNFKSVIANSKVKACENGNFSELKSNLVKVANSCKHTSDVKYLINLINVTINSFKKLSIDLEKALKDPTNPKYKNLIKRNKQGLTVSKINNYVNWLDNDYRNLLNKKASEIKNKKSKFKKESTNINIDDEIDSIIDEVFKEDTEDDYTMEDLFNESLIIKRNSIVRVDKSKKKTFKKKKDDEELVDLDDIN